MASWSFVDLSNFGFVARWDLNFDFVAKSECFECSANFGFVANLASVVNWGYCRFG